MHSTTTNTTDFTLSFICMLINLIYTAYFYSIKQTNKANIIAKPIFIWKKSKNIIT